MKEIDVPVSFGYYYVVLENADSFVAFDFDEALTEFVFTDLDTNLHSFYHEETLTKLLDNEYITKEIEGQSTELRNYYLSMVDADQWNVEGLTAKAPEWVELFAKIKALKDKVDQYDKPLPEYLTAFINELKAIPAKDFIAIGIYTTSNGPYLDDYFIEMVLKNGVFYSIASDFNNYYWIRVLEKSLALK
ncbi:MAG: hypothetical protein M0D57_11595 [Sphingobacteriales bacterium JAD_PAG50586_3]|nr:MAG: hypothetical protein M0D57_11595 [Sphingobacteriales bacterium JAD_PAG50586_3]